MNSKINIKSRQIISKTNIGSKSGSISRSRPSHTSALTFEEIKQLSNEFLLPNKVIYELHSEFNSLLNVVRQDNPLDLITTENDIPISDFLKNNKDLQEKHPTAQKIILQALGLMVNAKTVINWKMYLKLA